LKFRWRRTTQHTRKTVLENVQHPATSITTARVPTNTERSSTTNPTETPTQTIFKVEEKVYFSQIFRGFDNFTKLILILRGESTGEMKD
jgi:hypothetical protein